MTDQLIRALAAQGSIRVVGVTIKDTIQEARDRHSLSNGATVVLGRTMAAGLLLASNMKQPQSRINLRIRSAGPLGGLLVDAGLDGTVRGYVSNPAIEVPLQADGQPNVRLGLGAGYLYLLRDVGYGRPYQSTVELSGGEISDDIASFLSNSEQTASAIALETFVNDEGVAQAGGILVQILPKAHRDEALSQKVYDQVETLKGFGPLLAQGHDLEDIMQRLLGDLALVVLPERRPLRFHCPCSRERLMGAMRMFGTDELQDMIEKDNGAEATCDICGEVYQIGPSELRELIQTMGEEAIAARG